ncbi:MAG: thioredoxin domain-containing protein [Deltaproteobacteria bacterium]|nr:thioredoxin domain-containing protein [Deltaproteobacteria bacterium]
MLKEKWIVSAALVIGIFASPIAFGGMPSCKALKDHDRQVVEDLFSSLHPYDYCDRTFKECLSKKPGFSMVERLADRICKKIGQKQDAGKIGRWLSRRARSVLGTGQKARISLDGIPSAGDEKSPVILVEYACPRCPFCSKITPGLHHEIEQGRLKGKVRLYFKLFPLKSHEYSKEAALAFMAAGKQGKFWQYAVYSYRNFDKFCPGKLAAWAKDVGLDEAKFEKDMKNPELIKRLVDMKKEGILNHVEATPTFYMDGKKYVDEIDSNELIDVLEEEYARITGKSE